MKGEGNQLFRIKKVLTGKIVVKISISTFVNGFNLKFHGRDCGLGRFSAKNIIAMSGN